MKIFIFIFILYVLIQAIFINQILCLIKQDTLDNISESTPVLYFRFR